jgi:hypothetical protein
MSEVAEKIKKDIVLPTKVTIKPSRKHTWLPEGHDGSLRFSNAIESLTVQVNRSTGMLITGLDEETQARLEKKMGLPANHLSRNKKLGEYWKTFAVKVGKNGLTLEPATNTADEIAYRVMLAHTEVANSVEENRSGKWPFARYVMESQEEEVATINNEINLKLDAYKKLGEMTESEKKNFLKVYGKAVGSDAKIDFINAQIGKIVDTEPKFFLETVSNPDYKAQVFIKDCLASGVLKETAGKYVRFGGDVLAYSLPQLIDFLMNKDNSEVVAELKAQLQSTK